MRSSGILLHITSLPSATGVGTLAEVDRFIDFLVASKQTYWQILPITPTDFVNSPYASPSAFAGNTLVIDVDALAEQGLISEQTLADSKLARGNDFVYAKQRKEIMLREAYGNFIKQDPPKDYQQFCDDNEYWLQDYTLFCALKQHFGGNSWLYWEDQDIRNRVPEALKRYKELLSDEMDFVAFTQYVFFSQWKTFRNKLQQKGIQLVGDIPIYVNYDSADVWAHSHLFKLTKDKKPKCVAGVPPDYFSADGQLWGNPLYRWDVMKKDKYEWWTKRVEKCSQLFDVLRIDHFRAFDSYYSIAYGQPTARNGRWCKGVGAGFIKHLQKTFPNLTIIAEDLGDIPQSVLDLRDKCGLAGMKVVQFAFDGSDKNPFLPKNFPKHCVAYLGTHDNDTTVGWWNSLPQYNKDVVFQKCGFSTDEHISLQMIQILAQSNADMVIYTMQDVAERDTDCRMNTPGTLGCWKYMAQRSDFSNAKAKWLAQLTVQTGRANEQTGYQTELSQIRRKS